MLLYDDDDGYSLMVKAMFLITFIRVRMSVVQNDYNPDIIFLIFCIFVCNDTLVCMSK